MILAKANALRDEGRWPEAADEYDQFLQFDDSNPAIHVQYAHALKEAGRHREALAAYGRAIALAPDDPDAILHQAHLLKRNGEPAALQAFRRLAELDPTAVSVAELSRLEALFGDMPTRAGIVAPSSQAVAIPPSRPAARVVMPLPAGLHARRRAVRFVANVDNDAPAPKLRVVVDGSVLWSGEVETRPGSITRRIDSVFSFPEPDRPTDCRDVRIEALTGGVAPAQASLLLPYAARFEGTFEMGSPGCGRDRTGIARFVDHQQMTIIPSLRAMDLHGVPVPIAQISWKREGAGFEIVFSTGYAGALQLYPMWSMQELARIDASKACPDVATPIESRGDVIGRVLCVEGGYVEGWALCPGQLERTVIVDILASETLVGCGYANRPRDDLAETIGGTGAHGFRIALPRGLPENASLTARARGRTGEFAAGCLPAQAAGVLVAPARKALPAISAAMDTTSIPRSVAALLLCGDDTAWSDETGRKMAELGLPFHRIIEQDAGLPERFDAALAQIEQDLVLVLGEATIWDNSVLAPMEQALAASQAVLAVPILQPPRPLDDPGAPDRWGWSIDLSHIGGFLRPSPPSPWLVQAAETSNFMAVAGADWPLASLIDRRRWQSWGGLAPSCLPQAGLPQARMAMIAALAEVETVVATRATLRLRSPLPTAPIPLPDAAVRRLVYRLRKYPLSTGAVLARPPVIALLVTTTHTDALEGDTMAAREFATALSRILPNVDFRLIPRDLDGGADLSGIDAIICLRDDCNPRRFRHLSPSCRVVFWIRNCFDIFLESENWRLADEVWMSSERECARFREHTSLPARLLRLATNLQLFGAAQPDCELSCDICFTGSYWGIHREIAVSLAPEILDATVRIFGSGWEAVPELAVAAQGPVPYAQMPAIYASAKLVIDDANHVTVNSGSVNSRIYDAIAAGALPITNGIAGAHEVFGKLLPTYLDAHGLTKQIRRWLADEPGRQARVAALRHLVMEKHGFDHRALDAMRYLSEPADVPFIAVTGDGPCARAEDETSPDALAPLFAALAQAGWRAAWIPHSEWDGSLAAAATARLHVGAAPPPVARPNQSSVAWILSEADMLSARIVGHEDVVFVPKEATHAMPSLLEAARTLDWPSQNADFDTITACLSSLLCESDHPRKR